MPIAEEADGATETSVPAPSLPPPARAADAKAAMERIRSSGLGLRTATGRATFEFSVMLEVVTPILGGGARLREIDEYEAIRVSTIRGHLRFWWRALFSHQFASYAEMLEAESALWGRAADKSGGRSEVDIRVEVIKKGQIDDNRLTLSSPGAYALWPARSPHAPRRLPGTRFRLTVRGPQGGCEFAIRQAVKSWIVFGGYGSRTRRGLGSFKVLRDGDRPAGIDLPIDVTRADLGAWLGAPEIFAARTKPPSLTPSLHGAELWLGQPTFDGEKAWITALGWLRDFRQGSAGQTGLHARDPDPSKGNRPGRSHWPEADKLRSLSETLKDEKGKDLAWAHTPRSEYLAKGDREAPRAPAWPRAGFGLPIIGQFQRKDRNDQLWTESGMCEPYDFQLRWRSGDGEHDRLASPLIVKAMPIAGGKFVPCALWLCRAMPAGAGIVAYRKVDRDYKEIPASKAPFELPGTPFPLLGLGDKPLYKPLEQATLREAFGWWLAQAPARAKRAV